MTGIGIAIIVVSILIILEYDRMLLLAFSFLTGIGFIIAGSKLGELMKRVDSVSRNEGEESLPE